MLETMCNMKKVLISICTLAAVLVSTGHAAERLRGIVVSPLISAEDMAVLGTWKVRAVRYLLSCHGIADNLTPAEYDAWLDSAIASLDAKLPEFQKNGIRVILNLYTPPGGFKDYRSPALHRIFVEKWPQDAIVTAWQKIASHYAGNPVIAAYDLLNEPAQREVGKGLKNWQALAQNIAQKVRKIDKVHPIIVESVYGNPARLSGFKPIKASNVIYSFHSYSYAPFRTQGMNGKPINVSYPTRKFNKGKLYSSVKKAISFQRKYKVKFYVGEFSAVRWAPRGSGYRYLKDIINLFERYKWHWTYHAFRESDTWSLEHDSNPKNRAPASKETDRLKLMKKYFRK